MSLACPEGNHPADRMIENLTLGTRFEGRLATLGGPSHVLFDDLVGAGEDRGRHGQP